MIAQVQCLALAEEHLIAHLPHLQLLQSQLGPTQIPTNILQLQSVTFAQVLHARQQPLLSLAQEACLILQVYNHYLQILLLTL